LILITAGVYAYRDTLRCPFIFDDLPSIPENQSIRQLWPPSVVLSPPAASAVTGRPIVNLSLAVNYALDGLNVGGYHVMNLVLHLLAALALYGVVRRTLLGPRLRGRYGEAAPWLALAIALMWLVHPLLTESVTYIVQRTEVCMGLFFLLALYSLIRGAQSSRPGGWYAAAIISNALGIGSKEVMVVAPVVLLAYDRLFISASLKETVRRRWGLYAGLAAGWLLFAVLVRTRMGEDVALLNLSETTRWSYAKAQASVLVYYLRLALWPASLVGDYDDWPLAASMATILPAVGVVATLVGATVWTLRRLLPASFLGVWFFLILAPTSSFWPLPMEVAAERRMYLPLAAVIAFIVIGAHTVLAEASRRLEWPTGPRNVVEVLMLIAVVAILAQATVRRNEVYRSAVSFWSDVVAKRPNNARGHSNLGSYLFREGKLDESVDHFSEALRLKPGYHLAHNNLGLALAAQGRLEEAIVHFAEALRITPRLIEAQVNLEMARGRLRDRYADALRLNPNDVEAHYGLANSLAAQGRFEEAIDHYRAALRINPTYAQAHRNLGVALTGRGEMKEAIAHFSEALLIAPGAQAHYNLGAALARDGSTEEAIGQFQAALKLEPDYQSARLALEQLTSSRKK